MSSKLEKYNNRLHETAKVSQTWEEQRDAFSYATSLLWIASAASFSLLQAIPQEKSVANSLFVIGFFAGMFSVPTSFVTAVSQVALTTSKASYRCLTFCRRAHIKRNPTIAPLTETLVRSSVAPRPPETILVRPVYKTATPPEQLLRAGRSPAP